MSFLSQVVTLVRRYLKTPSNSSISDSLILEHIDRFVINDIDAEMQLFDYKTTYQFFTTPGVDRYNMPLYSTQQLSDDYTFPSYPVYQGFREPFYVNGIKGTFTTLEAQFYNAWPNFVQTFYTLATGDGTTGPYTIQIPILGTNVSQNPPVNAILRGHVDMAGIISTNNNIDPPVSDGATVAAKIEATPVTSVYPGVFIYAQDSNHKPIVVTDSGWLLNSDESVGFLMNKGAPPSGNTSMASGYTASLNTVNYLTGEVSVEFDQSIPSGNQINVGVYYFQAGLPRSALFYNNIITLRPVPARQYLVELQAYLTPIAFLSTSEALPFGYMQEYIALGAARKIFSEIGDVEQLQFYEQFFQEQKANVWKRSQRQFTATRTPTVYAQGNPGNTYNALGAWGVL